MCKHLVKRNDNKSSTLYVQKPSSESVILSIAWHEQCIYYHYSPYNDDGVVFVCAKCTYFERPAAVDAGRQLSVDENNTNMREYARVYRECKAICLKYTFVHTVAGN